MSLKVTFKTARIIKWDGFKVEGAKLGFFTIDEERNSLTRFFFLEDFRTPGLIDINDLGLTSHNANFSGPHKATTVLPSRRTLGGAAHPAASPTVVAAISNSSRGSVEAGKGAKLPSEIPVAEATQASACDRRGRR
jgi:hypothetical protein